MSNMNFGATSAAMQPLAARVIEVVAMILGDDEVMITTASRLDEDLQFDSLDTVEFLIELEDEFGISVSDEISEQWKTVQDVISTIATLSASNEAAQ